MSEAPDDHADMQDAVRAAFAQHSSDEPSHRPIEHEQHEAEQHENSQAATDVGLQVAALMNQEERQRAGESKKQRDERGRFAASAPSDATGSVPAGASRAAEAPAVSAPPSSWAPEAKQLFNELPQAVQAAIAKREGEISQGFSQYRDRTQQHTEIENVIAPRRQQLAQFGFKNDSEAVNHLLTISDGFARNPVGTLQFLAQQANIRPEQLFPAMQSAPSQQHIEAMIEQRVQLALAQTEIQRFESKAPEHYSVVKGLMSQLLANGAATTVQEAYKLACAQHPAVAHIEGQRQVSARRERQVRAMNASLSGAPHGVAATPPRSKSSGSKFGDVADDVRAALAALQ